MRLTNILFSLAIVFITIGCSGESQKTEPLRFEIWHTELDSDASSVIDSIASSVESEVANRSDKYQPIINVSALPWGDVSQRIFSRMDNPPDIVHLQPFMVREFQLKVKNNTDYRLYPLDSLIAEIEKSNEVNVHPAVRNLQKYSTNGGRSTYGLAYSVGTTFIAYRSDWNKRNIDIPKTWSGLISFADTLEKYGDSISGENVSPFILPGKSPFFIDQLLNEIVVSLGGSIYEAGKPNFGSREVQRALFLLQGMIARTNGRFADINYQQQFSDFGSGLGAVVPVTYGRATKQLDKAINDSESLTRLDFQVMPQPSGSSSSHGVATIDAEPWVVITPTLRSAETEADSAKVNLRREISKQFLESFYNRENYLKFVSTVPVHMRPIFPEMWDKFDSLKPQKNWEHWTRQSKSMLRDPSSTAPILMDPRPGSTKQATYALSMRSRSVISDMVFDAASSEVLRNIRSRIESGREVSSQERRMRKKAIQKAVSRAQSRALELYRDAPKP